MLGELPGQETPGFLRTAGFSSPPHLLHSGTDAKGEYFQLFQIGFGGIPGRPFGEEPDGAFAPAEFQQRAGRVPRTPFPAEDRARRDGRRSGGTGFFRDGNGIDRIYRFLEPAKIGERLAKLLLLDGPPATARNEPPKPAPFQTVPQAREVFYHFEYLFHIQVAALASRYLGQQPRPSILGGQPIAKTRHRPCKVRPIPRP